MNILSRTVYKVGRGHRRVSRILRNTTFFIADLAVYEVIRENTAIHLDRDSEQVSHCNIKSCIHIYILMDWLSSLRKRLQQEGENVLLIAMPGYISGVFLPEKNQLNGFKVYQT